MTWIIFCVCLVFMLWILLKLKISSELIIKRKLIALAFAAKVLSGCAITLIYTYYYTDRGAADIYKFFDDASVIASALPDDSPSYMKLITGFGSDDIGLNEYTQQMKNWDPQSSEWLEFTQTENYNLFQSNRIITRLNALLLPLSQGNIFTHILFFSFISLLSALYFIKTIQSECFFNKKIIVILILFLPSILLWCSAPLKDTLTLSCIMLLFYLLSRIKENTSISNYVKYTIASMILLILILFTKYYVILAFVPALVAYLILWRWHIKNKLIPLALLVFIGIALIYMLPLVNDSFDITKVLNNKREEAIKAALFGEANHLLFEHVVDHGNSGLLLESANAIATGLFRPYVWEKTDSILVKLSSLENLFLLALFLFWIYAIVKKRDFNSYIISLGIYLFFLAFIIGYTTPVAGGVMRYKSAFLPMFITFCLAQKQIYNPFRKTGLNKAINKYFFKTSTSASVKF